MSLTDLFQALENTAIGMAISSSELLFPIVESLHVVALTLVVGTIAVVDLRLLGAGAARRAASKLMDEVLPITRWAFVGAAITGGLLFSSRATVYAANPAFIAKMAVLALALVNIAYFHRITMRGIAQWDTASHPPAAVKLAGALSLSGWIAVVALGRWVGFL